MLPSILKNDERKLFKDFIFEYTVYSTVNHVFWILFIHLHVQPNNQTFAVKPSLSAWLYCGDPDFFGTVCVWILKSIVLWYAIFRCFQLQNSFSLQFCSLVNLEINRCWFRQDPHYLSFGTCYTLGSGSYLPKL